LAKDGGSTVWHMAAEQGNLDILYKLCDWDKGVLTPQ
jgi:hypothetical protein